MVKKIDPGPLLGLDRTFCHTRLGDPIAGIIPCGKDSTSKSTKLALDPYILNRASRISNTIRIIIKKAFFWSLLEGWRKRRMGSR
jgi:hypothetical protein